MITKEVLGKRVRDVRTRGKMTLKNVEGRSGLSSTHISEIERGMTSPTIGALIRIAHALQKDPSYFIEERQLDEVCVTNQGDRPPESVPEDVRISDGRIEALTRGVVCGRIRSYEIHLEPGGTAEIGCIHESHDVCFYCIEGKVDLTIGDRSMEMAPGDSIHGGLASVPHLTAHQSTEARVVLIIDPREEC